MTKARHVTIAGIETLRLLKGSRDQAPVEVAVQYEGLFYHAEGKYPLLHELVIVWAHVHGGPVVKGTRQALKDEYGPLAADLRFMLHMRVMTLVGPTIA